jgi:hypothetical protein
VAMTGEIVELLRVFLCVGEVVHQPSGPRRRVHRFTAFSQNTREKDDL